MRSIWKRIQQDGDENTPHTSYYGMHSTGLREPPAYTQHRLRIKANKWNLIYIILYSYYLVGVQFAFALLSATCLLHLQPVGLRTLVGSRIRKANARPSIAINSFGEPNKEQPPSQRFFSFLQKSIFSLRFSFFLCCLIMHLLYVGCNKFK